MSGTDEAARERVGLGYEPRPFAPAFLRTVMTDCLAATTEEVLDWFAELPGARRPEDAKDRYDWVFVPGTRAPSASVLLVAHCDTVSKRPPKRVDVRWEGRTCTLSWAKDASCLGGDDRCGVAALWLLHGLGHPLLLTNYEERGGAGARAAAAALKDELAAFCFSVEIDRAGDEQFVFYGGCKSTALNDWLLGTAKEPLPGDGLLAGWRSGHGSFTDVAILGDVCGLPGVNLAAGYFDNHGTAERISLDAWERSFWAVWELCQRAEIPRFAKDPVPVYNHRDWDTEWGGRGGAYYSTTTWDMHVRHQISLVDLPPQVTFYRNWARNKYGKWEYDKQIAEIRLMQMEEVAHAMDGRGARVPSGKERKVLERAQMYDSERRKWFKEHSSSQLALAAAASADEAEEADSATVAVFDATGVRVWLDEALVPPAMRTSLSSDMLGRVWRAELAALDSAGIMSTNDWYDVRDAQNQCIGFIGFDDLPRGVSIYVDTEDATLSYAWLYVELAELQLRKVDVGTVIHFPQRSLVGL